MKTIIMFIAMVALYAFAGVCRLFLPREKRRYYKEKVSNRRTPPTRARAINLPVGFKSPYFDQKNLTETSVVSFPKIEVRK